MGYRVEGEALIRNQTRSRWVLDQTTLRSWKYVYLELNAPSDHRIVTITINQSFFSIFNYWTQDMSWLRDNLQAVWEYEIISNTNWINFFDFQLLDFRRSIVKILGLDMSCPDYEIISKLSTLVNAHHDFTLVSKRYDEPLKSPCHHVHHRTPTPRYTTDDSGFMDPLEDFDSDMNNIYNKRPHRGLWIWIM